MIVTAKKPGRPAIHASAAEKQAAYLARAGKVQMNVSISAEVAEALDAYMARSHKDGSGLSKSETVEKLLRTQLLRKR